MRCYRGILRIKWTDNSTNENVFTYKNTKESLYLELFKEKARWINRAQCETSSAGYSSAQFPANLWGIPRKPFFFFSSAYSQCMLQTLSKMPTWVLGIGILVLLVEGQVYRWKELRRIGIGFNIREWSKLYTM